MDHVDIIGGIIGSRGRSALGHVDGPQSGLGLSVEGGIPDGQFRILHPAEDHGDGGGSVLLGIAECEIITMAPTVNRVVRMLSAIAKQNSITIETHLEQDCPILILEDDLYQIIFNLVENGIKYNVPGGKLSVSLLQEADNAVLRVADTGMGIPQEALDHIFERFYRVDKARSRATGGSGLGLAIVRSIVQRSRGQIAVESQVGKGTTFTVRFPVFDTEEDTP